jgi:ATP-dependent Clp protease ATP-binding subunit ClpA
MFERFTVQSRRAIVLAQEEARLLNHNYIGTEHLLLGLIADEDSDAAQALDSLDVTVEAARAQVREMIGEGVEPPTGHIPFTPRAKKVLELSLREALTLRSQSIGSVHLLLGLIAEGEGVGAQILERLGAPLATVRERAIEMAATGAERDPAPTHAEAMAMPLGARGSRSIRVEGLQDMLASIDRHLSRIDRHLSRIERHLGIAAEADDPEEEIEVVEVIVETRAAEAVQETGEEPGGSPGDKPAAAE